MGEANNWECPYCGSDDPHNALIVYDEIEIDVTCQSVYITPVDGGDGFAFDHGEFERIIEHYNNTET